jgi:hypothetical protein
MPQRAQLPAADRNARSKLVKLLADACPIARASLVTMARVCGKKECKCARGEKHVSLYLAARIGEKRKMIYVPPELEEHARALVDNIRKVDALIEQMSRASLEALAKSKQTRQRKKRP